MYETIRSVYVTLKRTPLLGGALTSLRNVISPHIERHRLRNADRHEAHRFIDEFLSGEGSLHSDIDRFASSELFSGEYGHGHSGDYDVLVLYAITRALEPEHIIETGVASGRSSAAILLAMNENGKGTLHSIDLAEYYEGKEPEYYQNQYGIAELKGYVPANKKVGWMVPEELRKRWELIIGDSNIELEKVLDRVGTVDVFYHDSDHSYETMSHEFTLAWPKINNGGFLIADDVTWNDAWKEFVANHKDLRTSQYRKFGILRK
jgi:predicted O-methyltransferase YrrM